MRVLAADDDPVMLQILHGFLTQRGFEVAVAYDGSEALAAHEEDPFNLLISDWVMPEMDGLDLTRAIRRQELQSYCYIILLTGKEDVESKIAAMDAGVDAFLSKPFNPGELEMQLKVAHRILSYLAHIRRLESLMPVCCCCKKIQDEQTKWHALEQYAAEHSETFHQVICPECLQTQVNPAMIPPEMLES